MKVSPAANPVPNQLYSNTLSVERIAHLEALQECRISYGLKEIYRYSKLRNRQESDMDHVGSLHILARWFVRNYDLKLDCGRMIDMLSMHDLHELVCGDTPTIPGVDNQTGKELREAAGMYTLAERMSRSESAYYLEIMREYREGNTTLSKFVRGLDKLEADIQCLTCREDWEGWTEEFYRKKRETYYRALPLFSSFYDNLCLYLKAHGYFSPPTLPPSQPEDVLRCDSAFETQLQEILIPFSLKEVSRRATIGERRESVMEHVGSGIMLARWLIRNLNLSDLDVTKVTDLFICHDLHESECGDTPLSPTNSNHSDKKRIEEAAIEKFALRLSSHNCEHYRTTMNEYLSGTTPEARFVHAVDALDAGIQCLSCKEDWRGWSEELYRSKRDPIMEHFPILKPFYEELVTYLRLNGYFDLPVE